MKLSEMRAALAERGIQLTKSLGQHFLHDAHQLDRIMAAAELKPTDKVLEIGPGLGPLTELLLAQAGRVLAIEKDGRLVAVLRERFGSLLALTPALSPGERGSESRIEPLNPGTVGRVTPCAPGPAESKHSAHGVTRPTFRFRGRAGVREDVNPSAGIRHRHLELLHADALEFLRREARDWHDWKLVANLPYSVASPILVELAQAARRPERLVATLQLEVAQRLMAGRDDADYGVLTLLVQLDYEPRGWFKIPAGCFFPAPDVDSACITLIRRAQPLLPETHRAAFVKIVKRAFSQRRKMMLKLLKQDWPAEALEPAFAELKISTQERAEKLSLDQFIELTRLLAG